MLAEILPKVASETQEKEHTYHPRPSLAGPERCIRSLVYFATNTPQSPLPGRALMVFDDSNWHETLTSDWINKTAFKLHSEQMVVDTPVGKGRIDGILTDLLGIDYLYEHKALNHFSFERIWNGDNPLDYFCQFSCYMVGVQKINPNITKGILLIKNKNTAQYMEFLLEYDRETDTLIVLEMTRSDGEKKDFIDVKYPNITKDAVEKFNLVEKHRKEQTVPDRPFTFGTDYPCGYCRWGKICWDRYEEEIGSLPDNADIGDADIQVAVKYYAQLGAQKKDITNEHDELKEKIKLKLKELSVRGGKCGEYIVSVTMQTKKEFIQKASTFEVLNVRKIKQEDVKNGKSKKLHKDKRVVVSKETPATR